MCLIQFLLYSTYLHLLDQFKRIRYQFSVSGNLLFIFLASDISEAIILVLGLSAGFPLKTTAFLSALGINCTKNNTKNEHKNNPTYPKMLKQTFPHLQRLGLNLTLDPPVVMNLTLGGLIGQSGGNRRIKQKKPPSYGVSKEPVIRAWTRVISESSGATRIPGGGSLQIAIMSLKHNKARVYIL